MAAYFLLKEVALTSQKKKCCDYCIFKHISNIFLKSTTEAVTGGFLIKKLFLKILAKFTGTYLCQSLFSNKVAGPQPY